MSQEVSVSQDLTDCVNTAGRLEGSALLNKRLLLQITALYYYIYFTCIQPGMIKTKKINKSIAFAMEETKVYVNGII